VKEYKITTSNLHTHFSLCVYKRNHGDFSYTKARMKIVLNEGLTEEFLRKKTHSKFPKIEFL
jgi:hypothetical protein